MKKIVVASLLYFYVLQTNAQTKPEKAVAGAAEQLHKAMVDADAAMLEKLTLQSLSYGHSSGHIDNKKEFVEKIVSGKSDFVSIDMEDVSIAVSGKVAIVRHVLFAKTNDNNKPGEVRLRVLLIWQKQHGTWKLLARQAIKIQ